MLSFPRALAVETKATADEAYVRTALPAASRLHVTFDVYIERRGENASIVWFDGGGGHVLLLQALGSGAAGWFEYAPNDAGQPQAGRTEGAVLPILRWSHVDLAVDFAAHLAIATVDGAEVVRRSLDSSWPMTAKGVFAVGEYSSRGFLGYYDNITLATR